LNKQRQKPRKVSKPKATRLYIAIRALYIAAEAPTAAGACTRCAATTRPIILRASLRGRPFQLCEPCEDDFQELAGANADLVREVSSVAQ
jgi:hypothetical protein